MTSPAPVPGAKAPPAKTRRNSGAPAVHRIGSGPAPTADFIATVPGTETPLLPVDLPPGLSGQARRRVAQRQMEEALGPSPSALGLRPLPRPGRNQSFRQMLVVPEERRRAWRAALAADMARTAAPGRCRAILPDYLALPAAAGIWTLAAEDGRILARFGPEDGFAAEPALAQRLLARGLDAAADAPPRALYCMSSEAVAFLDSLPADLRARFDLPRLAAPHQARALGLPEPAQLAHGEAALDLAQDAEAEAARLRQTLRPWIAAGLLMLLGLGLWSAATRMETRALRQDALALRREAETIARQALVPQGPILDLRLQTLRRIETLRAEAEDARSEAPPLEILRRAATVIAPAPARLDRAAFRPGSGLLIDLELPDFAALDRLAEGLRAAEVEARVAQSAAGADGAVSATIQLGPRGGWAR